MTFWVLQRKCSQRPMERPSKRQGVLGFRCFAWKNQNVSPDSVSHFNNSADLNVLRVRFLCIAVSITPRIRSEGVRCCGENGRRSEIECEHRKHGPIKGIIRKSHWSCNTPCSICIVAFGSRFNVFLEYYYLWRAFSEFAVVLCHANRSTI